MPPTQSLQLSTTAVPLGSLAQSHVPVKGVSLPPHIPHPSVSFVAQSGSESESFVTQPAGTKISQNVFAHDLPAVIDKCVEFQGEDYLDGVVLVPDIDNEQLAEIIIDHGKRESKDVADTFHEDFDFPDNEQFRKLIAYIKKEYNYIIPEKK